MPARILVAYYSATGSVHRLAGAVHDGATAAGAEVRLRRVAELAPPDAIAANPDWEQHKSETDDLVPVTTLDDLEWADGFAFGTPTRFGAPAAQLKQFLRGAARRPGDHHPVAQQRLLPLGRRHPAAGLHR